MRRVPLSSSVRIGLLALAAVGTTTTAQTLYRSVGPDGRVTYSDRAAPDAGAGKPAALRAHGLPVVSATLPYELREVAARYPVTLYTSPDCAPCVSARALLGARGVPFSERTVMSNDDIAALKNLSGQTALPFATVGTQPLSGFSDPQWTRMLDAAGYPNVSQLPANWQPPPALPLVQSSTAAAAAHAAAAAARPAAANDIAPPPPPASRGNGNPAGIRF